MEKLLILRLRPRIYKMNPEHLVMSERKGVLKNKNDGKSKRQRS